MSCIPVYCHIGMHCNWWIHLHQQNLMFDNFILLFQKCDECGLQRSRWLLSWPPASPPLDMSTCLSSACRFIIFCTSSLIIMPVKYMREIMENFQAFCNQTSLHGWQYITQRPETDGFWAGKNNFTRTDWKEVCCSTALF